MTKKQTARVDMFNLADHYLLGTQEHFATASALKSSYSVFRGKLNTLNSTVGFQSKVLTGIPKDKHQLKELLANLFAENAGQLRAFAFTSKNNTLLDAMKLSANNLLRKNDLQFTESCKGIRQFAFDHLKDLADYGIDDTAIKAMDDLIDQFTSDAPATKLSINQRVVYRSGLEQQITEVDNLLKNQLDMLMLPFQRTNPSFYRGYKESRKIIDPRTSATQVVGIVTDKATGKALSGVPVVATLDDIRYEVVTDEEGRFIIRTPKPGHYTLLISAEGHAPVTMVVETGLGKKTELEVSL